MIGFVYSFHSVQHEKCAQSSSTSRLPSSIFLNDLISYISDKFEITVSPLSRFLGLQIIMDKDHTICLNQKPYILSMLKRFQMENCRSHSIPSDNSIYTIDVNDKSSIIRPYRELIGSLNFAALCSRPDIAFSVAYLSRCLDNYTEHHWNAALKILQYLQGTSDLSIVYSGGAFDQLQNSLEIYTDSVFASDKQSRRSVSGSVTKLNGGPIL